MIYFIETQGMVKIGYSANPRRRMRMLSTGCPTPCTLIAVAEGGRDKEADLHEQFSPHRANGEWFRFHGSIQSYIAENAIHAPPEPSKGPKNAPPRWNEIAAAAKACGAGSWAMRKWLERCEIPPVWKLKIISHTSGMISIADMDIEERSEAAVEAAE